MGRLPHLLPQAARRLLGELCGAAARGSCPAASRLWTPICPICCFPCCCYCERAPDTGAFVQRRTVRRIPGQYLLLDHERGTIGCYAAVCCTNRLNAGPLPSNGVW